MGKKIPFIVKSALLPQNKAEIDEFEAFAKTIPWMEHGDLDTPVEYVCKVAHVQAEYLGLIKKGEKAWEVEDWKERIDQFGLTNVKIPLSKYPLTAFAVVV